jgi:hypothetical protein
MATIISGDTGVDKVVDGSIAAVDLATDAVTTAKILASNVTTAKILDSNVTNAKMADDAIGIAELSATGTASSSTFLRGDNAWATPAGGGVSLIGTIATTSGTSRSLTSVNLSLYNKVYFNFDQVSPATGSSTLRISINGAATLDLGTAIAIDRALFGELQLDLNSNVLNLSQSSPSGTPISTGNATDGANEKNFLYQVQTDLTALTSTTIAFTWSTGNAFDNGRILVYGLK